MTIYQKLAQIQQKIKCPKNQYNSFGKYNYRNAESILEAFKPYEAEYNCMLILCDDIKLVGDRLYVMAEAKLIDLEEETSVSTYGFAREADAQKGMDAAQITGCASSYARKYALNALFLLDDTKDADTDEFYQQTQQAKKQQNVDLISEQDLKLFTNDLMHAGANIRAICQKYKVNSLAELTAQQANEIMDSVRGA